MLLHFSLGNSVFTKLYITKRSCQQKDDEMKMIDDDKMILMYIWYSFTAVVKL